MAKDVVMLAPGMAQETGTRIQWRKAHGDTLIGGETGRATAPISATPPARCAAGDYNLDLSHIKLTGGGPSTARDIPDFADGAIRKILGRFDASKRPQPGAPSEIDGFSPTPGVSIRAHADHSFSIAHRYLLFVQYITIYLAQALTGTALRSKEPDTSSASA